MVIGGEVTGLSASRSVFEFASTEPPMVIGGEAAVSAPRVIAMLELQRSRRW